MILGNVIIIWLVADEVLNDSASGNHFPAISHFSCITDEGVKQDVTFSSLKIIVSFHTYFSLLLSLISHFFLFSCVALLLASFSNRRSHVLLLL